MNATLTPETTAAKQPAWMRFIASTTRTRTLVFAGVLFVLLAFTRQVTDANDLTSSGTVGTTLRVTIPIMLAGLAALWSERVGIVNIGIEGMMILGTWFGGYGAWQFGPWYGLLFGILGGAAGGLIHALAVVKFNVNHIISGVAMNLFAFGAMRYLSEIVYAQDTAGGKAGGGISKSPKQQGPIPRFNMPFLGGGKIFGWRSPDLLGWFERRHWFLLGDAAGILRGLMVGVSWASVLALLLVPVTGWVLWRSRFGLRVRSSGEAPSAAESLGVKVSPLRYISLAISGGLAGFGGAFLSIVSANYYQQGQTQSKGYIGIATTIFGNWRPSGVLGGATLFGFAEALNLVGKKSLPNLFLFGTLVCGLVFLLSLVRRKTLPAINAIAAGALLLIAFLTVNEVPEPLTKALPYVTTLIVLAVASQRLRPPAHAGLPYRSGENH